VCANVLEASGPGTFEKRQEEAAIAKPNGPGKLLSLYPSVWANTAKSAAHARSPSLLSPVKKKP
jgi:hypothetical protein